MMNKKGQYGGLIFIIIFLGLMIFGIITYFNQEEAIRKSCEDMGMEYYYSNGQAYCIDNNGEAHYAKIDCEGIINFECNARLISIGNLRVISERGK